MKYIMYLLITIHNIYRRPLLNFTLTQCVKALVDHSEYCENDFQIRALTRSHCRIHHQYCCLLHTVDPSPGQVAWPALPSGGPAGQQVPVARMNSSQLVTHRPPPPHHHRPGVENAMHIVTVLITSSPQYSRSCHSRHIQSLILMNVRMALE